MFPPSTPPALLLQLPTPEFLGNHCISRFNADCMNFRCVVSMQLYPSATVAPWRHGAARRLNHRTVLETFKLPELSPLGAKSQRRRRRRVERRDPGAYRSRLAVATALPSQGGPVMSIPVPPSRSDQPARRDRRSLGQTGVRWGKPFPMKV